VILEMIEAIHILRPDAQWVIQGEDYTGLEWLDKKQTKPTEQEIEAKIAELPALKAAASAQKAAQKAALLAKLGITSEEAALLLG
jgi:hypothetical protein